MGIVVRVANPEIKTGYLPRLHFIEGVHGGDFLVICINDNAYAKMINILEIYMEFSYLL